ncbi:hypothetical protein [Paenibacillus sp. SYP-B4298]|uniref:hypothetical protein n=1 Tax=Paenibacillus sp. SYP-B4298 TaxID=2996034 RepID=UPI003FA7E2F1
MQNRIQGFIYSAIMVSLLAGVLMTPASVHASAPSYNYSYWGTTVAAPAAYQASLLENGEKSGAGAFQEPSDLYVSDDQEVYVLDSGNNRVVVLDEQLKLIRIIDSFGGAERFNKPQGIFVTEAKHVYIADTGNRRVVHLDEQDRLVKIIEAPQSDLLQSSFVFQPARVVVDRANRVYVMAIGVFDGFMEFNADGEFTSFIGANRVSVDPVEYLWKLLSTREQRSQMVQFTPTEFTSLDIDREGFIYATNGDSWGNTVKKLNAQGADILRRGGYFDPGGDIRYTSYDGPPRLIDIDVTDSEIYSVLDAKKGRIFTYDGDGYLLYIFGDLGNRTGEFHTPVAIERLGDRFLVLDRGLGEITVFETTQYGRVLNDAVRSYYQGDEEQAAALFEQAVNMNANLEYAYNGLGKAALRQGNYKQAVEYFNRSMDRKYYSKAFVLYRKETLRSYFPTIMTGLVVGSIAVLALRKILKTRGRKKVVSIE